MKLLLVIRMYISLNSLILHGQTANNAIPKDIEFELSFTSSYASCNNSRIAFHRVKLSVD